MNAILPDTPGYERCLLVAILTTDPGACALPYLANGLTFSRQPREPERFGFDPTNGAACRLQRFDTN